MEKSSPTPARTERLSPGRRFVPGVVLSLVCCLSACTVKSNRHEARVKKGDWQRIVLLNGSLQAFKSEEFKVPQTSTWRQQIKWLAREGDDVKPGDVVVIFDPANLAAEIEANKEALKNRSIEMAQKEADFRHQQLELEVERKSAENDLQQREIDASVPEELQSKYEYEQKQLEKRKSVFSLDSAETKKKVNSMEIRTQIDIMRIEIGDLRRKLITSQSMLDSLVIKAQTAGTVVYGEAGYPRRKIQIGDTVFTGRTVATIPDSSSFFVQGWISETHMKKISVGQKVDLIPDAFPDRQYQGRIKSVFTNAEPSVQWGKAHYFRVDIELEKLDPRIMKPGMSMCCKVYGDRCRDALQIPLEMTLFNRGSFWIKPIGREAIKLQALDYDEFVVVARAEKNRTVSPGMRLEPARDIIMNKESRDGEEK
ncbi:MAG: HlyD family efflux transporter periplasmic adaptor subunit [Acidobacteria bacterium]|nr:HlyD family efflux transporter periplasmic adaptor subunit [Acidobacteriota bacterium]MBU4307082.1 HlyD family efflux transporter periplasmic adaptor subunit [Acidobacteriota bacterium]MCG2811793.1 HlyD family efflux transporter periplasmic adaptor subunit [Candidatus Aminicenantes bacterium]